MRVRQIMTRKVVTIPVGTPIRDAARLLVEKGVTGAPVVDAEGKVVGLVSEKDLFRALYPSEEEFVSSPELWTEEQALIERATEAVAQPIEQLMSPNVIAVTPDTSLIRVGALLLARGIHRVLVMEGGILKGIVSRRDIYHAIFRKELKF